MDALSINQIRVSCDIPYKEIMVFECREKVNEHTEIHIKLLTSYKTLEWFENHSLCDRNLKIVFDEAAAERLVGNVMFAQWGEEKESAYVDIWAYSGTKKMDMTEQKSYFQQVSMTYGDFLKDLMKTYYGIGIIVDEKQRKKKLEYPVIQYYETDWMLVKKIACYLNTVVFIDSRQENPRVTLGKRKGKEHELKDLLKIEKILYRDKEQFLLTTWENYQMGDEIKLYNETLTILEKRTLLKGGLLEYTYHLGHVEHSTCPCIDDGTHGVSVKGSILEVKGEYVKLKLQEGDERFTEQLYAYRYMPVTGNAMYAMPEKGSEVELYIPALNSSDAYVRNCFLPNEMFPHESIKFMETSDHKTMEMSPGRLAFKTQRDQSQNSIELDWDVNETMKSSHKIALKATENIIIKAEASCKIDSTGVIELKQEDTLNSIELSGSRIKMSAEYYEVSSDPKASPKGKAADMDFVMTKANECVLAAIPMQECDPLCMKVIASIPQVLSVDSLKNVGAGFFRIY